MFLRSLGCMGPIAFVFVAGCSPRTTYSAALKDPRGASIVDEEGVVALPAGASTETRALASRELPLGLGACKLEAKRTEEGALEATLDTPRDAEHLLGQRLVDGAGTLVQTTRPPVLASGELRWMPPVFVDEPCVDYGRGAVVTPLANVTKVERTTTGRRPEGALATVVGAILVAGGGTLVGVGVEEKSAAPVAIGAPLAGVGLVALGVGIYHLTLPTRSETLYAPLR